MSDEIKVLGDGEMLPFATASDTMAQLKRYDEVRNVFMNWIKANLKPGSDFMLIHRKLGPKGNKQDCPSCRDRVSLSCDHCGAKPTLTKSGAQKISSPTGLIRCYPRFRQDLETWTMFGSKPGVICYVCELVNEAGKVLAEGRGARDVQADFGDINKTVKMTQKSAHVDAAITLVNAADLFTQDLEDLAGTSEDAGRNPGYTPPATVKDGHVVQHQPRSFWEMDAESKKIAGKMKFQLMTKLGLKLGPHSPGKQANIEWASDALATIPPDEYLRAHMKRACGHENSFWIRSPEDLVRFTSDIEGYMRLVDKKGVEL